MQPYVFPYLGYFQLIHAADVFVFYDDVNFIKKGWINRNQILLNKEAFKFTIPLIGASQNKLINEIDVFWESKFERKFLLQLEQSYQNAPHYKEVLALLSTLLNQKPQTISDLAIASIQMVCNYIGLERTFIKSSTMHISKDLGRAERLMAITKRLNSSSYINAINGQELYQKETFKQYSIDLGFLSPILNPYPQGENEFFIPFLSILDAMMWNEKDQILSLISSYEIV